MGKRGPVGKSAKEVALAGTARPCRPKDDALRPSAEPLEAVPDVPVMLAGHTHAEGVWKWLAPLLVRNRSLAEQDLMTLANLCLAQGWIIASALGEKPESKGAHALYKTYGAALGLAPAWRQRAVVSAKDEETKKNPFDAFRSDGSRSR